MPKFRDQACIVCGEVEYNTATRADTCLQCTAKARAAIQIEKDRAILDGLGYTDIVVLGLNHNGKREWSFVHPNCGVQQTWVYSNITKRLREDPTSTPCSHYGGQRRSKNATAQSAENRKIKNPVGWIDYKSVVRRITENVYAKHKDEINPLGLKRGQGREDYHLDHIVSVAESYELGLDPEFVARKENLQMLPSFENLSKGRK